MFPDVLDDDLRRRAADLVRRLGDRLGQEGYRGFFEVDVLVDVDANECYLGELNPRISGASAITNVTAGAYADVPLFAFHLLEFSDVDFDLDIDEINERWRELAAVDLWSHMIVKETSPMVELITESAPTGQYTSTRPGRWSSSGPALDWHQLQNEYEAFFLRIYGAGDYRWKGADLGVIVTKGRMQHAIGDGSFVADHPGQAPDRLDPRPVHRTAAYRAGQPASGSGHSRHRQVVRQVRLHGRIGQLGMIGSVASRPPFPVTLDNWQSADQLGWTFQHMAEIFPTAVITPRLRAGAESPRIALRADRTARRAPTARRSRCTR